MNWKIIWAIARKDWKEVRQNPSAWAPMLVIPLIFMVIFPLAMILASTNIPGIAASAFTDPDMAMFMDRMPDFMRSAIAGLSPIQSGIVLMLGYVFAPFFLIIPLMFTTVIASEAFAGEYERKTIEALLYTAASDTELFVGKVMAAVIPAISITLFGFALYTGVVNGAAYPVMNRIWFPLPSWIPLIFWIAPAVALAAVSATVLISARVKTFMGTYQASASTVVLVIGLLVGQISGVLYLSVGVGLAIGAVIWLIGAVLTFYAVRTFNRQKLLASAA